MSDREQPGMPEQYRLAGEDTPIWLTIGFSFIGLLLFATALWLWANQRANLPLQAQSAAVTGIQEQNREPAIAPSVKPETEPVPTAGETSTISVVAQVNNNTQADPATPSSEPSATDIPEKPIDQQDDSLVAQAPTNTEVASLESSEQPVGAAAEETPQVEPLSPPEQGEQQDDSAAEISLTEIPTLTESGEQPTESAASSSALTSSPTEPSEQPIVSTTETPSASASSSAETSEPEAGASADSGPNTPPAFTALKNCPPVITISFNRGSIQPTVTADIQEQLQQLQAWLNDQPKEKLLVAGHADSTGSERGNLLISHQRAKRVAELLGETGVSQEQLIILAFGEHNPIDGIPTDAEENRRVSLQIRDSENCQVMSTKR